MIVHHVRSTVVESIRDVHCQYQMCGQGMKFGVEIVCSLCKVQR